MATYEWMDAEIREEDMVFFGDGEVKRMIDDEIKDFLKKAGKNAKVLVKANWIELFYNTDTGDIFIPKAYKEEKVAEIKKAFLRFISKDDHEDIPYKKVEIED